MQDRSILVLGSGPIRIGQGIEFDYSCVHCVWALEELGYRAIIVNNNPETVSTDFDTGDGLYFEPVTLDDVLRVVKHERPLGAVVQFGGQTAINLASALDAAGVPILGTPPSAISAAEDRDLFERLLSRLSIPKPPGRAVRSLQEAEQVADEVGYPVLVRPSFVLGGRAMEVVYGPEQLAALYHEADDANPGQPVLVDKYFFGVEAEVDVISDGEETLVPGIMQHIERAGVHSGDSMAVFPPVSLPDKVQADIVRYACLIAVELGVKGIMNIQFVIVDDEVFVIEVNPRASRTVPYLSKVTGIPMVRLATRTMMGERLRDLGYQSGLWIQQAGAVEPGPATSPRSAGSIAPLPELIADPAPWLSKKAPLYAVKAPVFSFQKLAMVEPSLGPEMKSTGEVLGLDRTYEGALYKALVAAGITFRPKGVVIVSVTDDDKATAVSVAKQLRDRGYKLAATGGTHDALLREGIESEPLKKIKDGSPNILELLFRSDVSLMINTPGPRQTATEDAQRIRRACIETGVACVTNIDTAQALADALKYFEQPEMAACMTVGEYVRGEGS